VTGRAVGALCRLPWLAIRAALYLGDCACCFSGGLSPGASAGARWLAVQRLRARETGRGSTGEGHVGYGPQGQCVRLFVQGAHISVKR
jgi:hypothetical protein